MSESTRDVSSKRARALRIAFYALAPTLVLLVMGEIALNGADDPFFHSRFDAPDDYARGVCGQLQQQFLATRSPSLDPCSVSGEVAEFLGQIEKRDRPGYHEEFSWRCAEGGQLTVSIRGGVNWTGLCLRCKRTVGHASCGL